MAFYLLFDFVIKPFNLHPCLKGLPGDADHIANSNCLEQSRIHQLISRSAADAQNGCDIAYRIGSALCGLHFFRSVVVHNNFLSIC